MDCTTNTETEVILLVSDHKTWPACVGMDLLEKAIFREFGLESRSCFFMDLTSIDKRVLLLSKYKIRKQEQKQQ